MHQTLAIRFAAKYRIDEASGCWEWGASKNHGYGQIGAGGKRGKPLFAHRVSYELHKGTIPDGLVIDHLCRNRGCVNPEHLRVTTRGENVMCGEGIAAQKARATACPNGHEYTQENIYWHKGHRLCRTCRRIADSKR